MVKRPSWLKNEAADFWRRNAPQLIAQEILTELSVDTFAQLCETWRLMRTTNPATDSKEAMKYNGFAKQFFQLSKQFGLLPRDSKKAQMTKEETLADKLQRLKEAATDATQAEDDADYRE